MPPARAGCDTDFVGKQHTVEGKLTSFANVKRKIIGAVSREKVRSS